MFSIDGNKVRYLEAGNSNTALVLVHGLGASAERWEFVIPIFENYYRVIVPDLLGFGYSDKPLIEYTPDFFADFLEKFFHKLNIKKNIHDWFFLRRSNFCRIYI